MAKWQNDNVLDSALDYILDNMTTIWLCGALSDSPTMSEVYDASLLDTPISSGTAGVGKEDGTISGRKLVIPQLADLTIDESGTAVNIVISAGSTTALYVTTCVNQELVAGNLVTIPSWEIEIRDAV